MQRPVALISAGKRLPIWVLSRKLLPRLGDGHDDNVFEADDVYSERGHVEGLGDAVQSGLGEIVERVTSKPMLSERQHACIQRVALGVGVERNQLLGDQCPENVETGARHQPKLFGDGMHPQRPVASSKRAQDRRRARDSWRFARFHGARERTVPLGPALPAVVIQWLPVGVHYIE